MQNGALFLHTHEGVLSSQKYGKPDKYKSRKQHYAALTGSKNTKNLTSTSLENNITAAEAGRKIWKT